MFDRFNICRAYYAYAMEWHSGQNSKAYRIFGRLHKIKFSPGASFNGYESLSEDERVIYDGLVAAKY